MSKLHLALLPLLTPSVLMADVSTLEGPAGGGPPGFGSVRVVTAAGATTTPNQLQGIQLLPVDFNGRVAADALRPDRPRLLADIPGATRIALPAAQGSLYRYRRDDAGGSVFGYFLVDAEGKTRPLLELIGGGPLGTDDPAPHEVSLCPGGTGVLISTTTAAGGSLLEVDFATGALVDHTIGLGAQKFLRGGLCFLDDWGLALTRRGALRIRRGVPGSAEPVAMPERLLGFNRFVGRGVAASADQSKVAFVCGPLASDAFVFCVGRTGSATRVSEVGGTLLGAGYLPDTVGGPTLALSSDGSCVGWRSEGPTREAWVRRTDVSNAPPAFQITADERFADTLGETGVIGFVSPSSLIFLVGEPDPMTLGAVENGDLFAIDTLTNEISNITQTSGETAAPFLLPGQLASEDGIWRIPGSSRVLVLEDQGSGTSDLLAADPLAGQAPVLLQGIRCLDQITLAGSELLLGVERSNAARDVELHRLVTPTSNATQLFARLPQDWSFLALQGGSDGTFAVELERGFDRWLARGHVPSGTGSFLTRTPAPYGVALDVLADGSVLNTVQLGASTLAFSWSSTGSVKPLLTTNASLTLLPAN